MAQIIDGNGIASAFSNFGTAIFGDPTASANARYRNDMLALQRQKMSLDEGEMVMKAPLYDAQRQAAIANAANSNASAQQTSDQTRAASELSKLFLSGISTDADGRAFLDPQKIAAVAASAAAANPKGNTAELLGGVMGFSRQQLSNASEQDFRTAAAMQGKIPTTDAAFTTAQADRNTSAKPTIIPEGGRAVFHPNDPKNPNYVPPGNPSVNFNQAPAEIPSSMLADAVAAPVGAARNTISNPKKQSFAQAPSNPYVPYSPDPAQEKSAYNAWLKDNPGANNVSNLVSLNMLERFTDGRGDDPYQGYGGQALSFVPSFLGGNPAAQQFRQQSSILASRARTEPGAVSNYEQQLFLQRVPNLANNRESNAAIIQVGKIGAQKATEADIWLQRFIGSGGSFAQGQSLVNEYNSDPRNLGVSENPDGTLNLSPNYPKIDQWYQEKLSGFQPTQTQQSNPLANTVASGAAVSPAAAPSSSADPDIVKAMQIVAQYPGEKDRVNEMLIRAGKPPIK